MFKAIKQIKIIEAEKKLEQLKAKEQAMYAELYALKEKLLDYERKLERMEWQNEHGMKTFYAKRFSLRERIFNAKTRNEYQIYQNKLEELKSLPNEITALTNQIATVKKQTNDKIASSGIEQKILEAQNTLLKIKNATTLAKLCVTPTEAKEILEKKGITPTIDKEDRIITKPLHTFTIKTDQLKTSTTEQELSR